MLRCYHCCYSFLLFLLKKRRSLAVYGLMISTILALCFAKHLPIRINFSASMPRGIYLLPDKPAVNRAVNVGDFVMVCLDKALAQFALQRGYLQAGQWANGIQPLLKQVVAKQGDDVELLANSVIIDGKTLAHSAPFVRDSANRTLPAIPRGIYLLKTNQLWLYGTESAKSWDSRYFGAVDTSTVVSVVTPLLIDSGRKTI